MKIDKHFLRPDRIEYLETLATVLPAPNKRRRALYLLSGGDFVTGYLLSGGATETIMVDRLPFHGKPLSNADYVKYRDEYYNKKYKLNFSVEPDLYPEVGCLQYLLWELEAMGITDSSNVADTVSEDSAIGVHTLRYHLPGQAEKTIYYYQVTDACDFQTYPPRLLKHIQKGIDCLIRKAAVNIPISLEAQSLTTASMDQNGLMFIDDQSQSLLSEIDGFFCSINETCLESCRRLEAERSITFGYNPVTVYQSIAARREWEVQRRMTDRERPAQVIYLDHRPSIDTIFMTALIERGRLSLVIPGGNHGAAMLKDQYPDRVIVESNLSPESVARNYIDGNTYSLHILGDGRDAEYFRQYPQVKYFVTTSVNYIYPGFQPEALIALSLCGENALPDHEHIFTLSFDTNTYWLNFNLFTRINPHDVESEISVFAGAVTAALG